MISDVTFILCVPGSRVIIVVVSCATRSNMFTIESVDNSFEFVKQKFFSKLIRINNKLSGVICRED